VPGDLHSVRRAALYLRISEDKRGDEAAVSRQREDTRLLAQQRGYSIVGEHVDNDISAAGRRRRPGFEALLETVAAETVDVILSWSLDRLTRNRRDQVRLIEACQRHRVSLVLVKGADIDMSSAAGRMTADILASVARHEIEQKSERQVRANRQAMEEGRMTGGPRAFGYQTGGLHLDAKEAPLLRQAYERWLAGSGLEELADWLNRSGVSTPKGNRWRANTIRVVLANPRNAGLRAMKPIVDEQTGRRATWHDRHVAKAVWPGVVPEEVYAATMSKLRDPNRPGINRTAPKGPTARYLLSGIAKCGVCGERMITGAGGNKVRRLNCVSKRHINRKAELVEAYVVQRLLLRLSEPNAHELLLPAAAAGPDLEQVRLKQLVIRQQLLDLVPLFNQGVLDREQMKASGDQLRAELFELDSVIAAAGRSDVVAPLVAAGDPADVWETYLLSTQRLVVQRLMDITIHRAAPGRPKGGVYDTSSIQIEWRDQV